MTRLSDLRVIQKMKTGSGAIPSVPASGYLPVTNLYVEVGGELVVEYDDAPGATSIITSIPAVGGFPVTNLTVLNDGRLNVEYDK